MEVLKEHPRYKGIRMDDTISPYAIGIEGMVVVPDALLTGNPEGGPLPQPPAIIYSEENGAFVSQAAPSRQASPGKKVKAKKAVIEEQPSRKIRVDTPMGSITVKVSSVAEDGMTLALIGSEYEPSASMEGETLRLECLSTGREWTVAPLGLAFTHPVTAERIVVMAIV